MGRDPNKISRDTFLTAFNAWWLCYFVVPSGKPNTIRPSVFVMANTMAPKFMAPFINSLGFFGCPSPCKHL